MKFLNYLSLICILAAVGSFFLPIYESIYSGSQTGGIRGIVEIYHNGDLDLVVINGFGSFYAVFAVILSLLLGIGIFFVPKESSFPIVSVILYGISLILTWLGTISIGGPIGDKMLVGFFLSFIANGVLIIISFYKVNHLRMLDKFEK